jgi:hypothetical protein
MTIVTTQTLRVAGAVVNSGTTATYDPAFEADLVSRGVARFVSGDPRRPVPTSIEVTCESLGASPVASAAENAQAIQAALNRGGVVRLSTAGTYLIDRQLVISSNTRWVIGPGITIKLAAGGNTNVLVNAAYLRADVNISSLTSSGLTASATTASAHGFAVGDYVAVNWATPEWYSGVYQVASVPSSTEFTYIMAAAPSNATASAGTGGQIKCRLADVNIALDSLGTIDQDEANQNVANLTTMGVILSHVHNLYVSGRYIRARKYNVFVACATRVTVENVETQGISDGVHCLGPLNQVLINGHVSKNDDNAVAVLVGDYSTYHISEGAILGAEVRNVHCRGNTLPAVRVLGSSAYSVSCVIDGVTGALVNCPAIDSLQDANLVPDGNSWVRSLVIRNVSVATTGSNVLLILPKRCDYLEVSNVQALGRRTAQDLINLGQAGSEFKSVVLRGLINTDNVAQTSSIALLNAGTFDSVQLENCDWRTSSTGSLCIATANATLKTLTVRNCYVSTTSSGSMIDCRGPIQVINVDGCRYDTTVSGQLLTLSSTANVEQVMLANVSANGDSSSKIVNVLSGATLARVSFTGAYADTSGWAFNSTLGTDVTITCSGCTFKSNGQGNLFRHAGSAGAIKVRSAGCDYPSISSALVKTSTGTLEAYGWDIPMNVANLAAVDEQFCRNTNASEAGGVGLARLRSTWARI